MILDAFRRIAPWHHNGSVDAHYATRVEETLSNVRIVLVLLSLVVVVVDPLASPRLAGNLALGMMAVYSLAAAVALRAHKPLSFRQVMALHAADTSGILLVLLLTGGAVSPFSTLFLFVLLAAGYRWGQFETWTTAALGIVALGAHAVLMRLIQGSSSPDLHVIALRLMYAGVGGILIGYMAETERVQRRSVSLVSKILGRVQAEGGVVAAVRAVLDELMVRFRATHGVLVFEEEGSDRVALWHAERVGRGLERTVIRLNQELPDAGATYSFPVPAAAAAFKVRRPDPNVAPDRARLTALDSGGARLNETFSVAPLFGTPFAWQTAFCVSTLAGQGWKGRLFLFMPFDPPAVRDQLRCLRGVVRQVGPALFNLYLQRRLRSRAGVVERARISRELHDGVIQALIGIEMQLEVLRREVGGSIPDPLVARLADIQKLLGQEVLDVRDLMRLLKPEEVDAKRLVEHLADMVERFRYRTGIHARLVCEADEIDLTPRACREVAGIVQEALANVRKHSGATSVVVRLERRGGNWRLVVDDNGCGLDFDGYLTPGEVDAQRKGPVIIKERARAIGGAITLRSQRGGGTQLEITIPPKHHA